MNAIADAVGTITDAIKSLTPIVRAYTDPAATVAPPGVVIGPPTLSWDASCSDPTVATFHLFVIVKQDARATEALWDLVPLVAAALDELTDGAVTTATPGTWDSGGTVLPCYTITLEIGLN